MKVDGYTQEIFCSVRYVVMADTRMIPVNNYI